ncbi:hypothetical protein DFR74_10222 [Nocardia puris]|uniref:Uncharacterized protein n=1 Tax=Nocardia puris TaxID=208602 RepID=A0A366DU40_9NOCA|nr:hypothetical protein DFR74_10222 [Nocardia puris]
MVTIAQLRAVLAILHIQPEPWPDPARPLDPAAEHARLLDMVHRVVTGELQRAAVPGRSTDQARTDARWLHDRIDALAEDATVDPAPVLLDAAARSAGATEVLLTLTGNPAGGEADSYWRRALTDLGHAYHLINDEYVGRSNTTTAPLR